MRSTTTRVHHIDHLPSGSLAILLHIGYPRHPFRRLRDHSPRNYPYIPDVAYQRVRLVNRANSFYRHFSCRDFDVSANASNCGPFPPPNRTVNSSS